MGSVHILLSNGQLGTTLQTNDGIAGMVLTGMTDTGGYATGTPVLVTSLDDLATKGITATDNPFAWRQVKEFYDEAGSGAQLYLLLAGAGLKVSDMADNANAEGARKLLNYAGGKIRLLGLMTDDQAVYSLVTDTVTHGISDDVYTAASNSVLLAAAYYNAEQPFRVVIGGTSYNGTAASLTDMTAGTTNNRTAILIGDTQAGRGACLGLLLGRLSAIPVQRKVSRVRTGPMSNTAAFYGVSAAESLPGDSAVIAGKGFITWCTYPNVSGYFFSGDDTCSAVTDDYHYLARGRVTDKVHILAYTTFIQEVDDEVPVNDDGTLDAGFCQWLSRQIENQVNETMTASKEISRVACVIDPAQNILSSNQLNVVLKITPVGYATDIEISLGFSNPAA